MDLKPSTPFHGRPVERRGDFERAAVHDRHGGPDRIAVLHPGAKDFGAVNADGELDLTHGRHSGFLERENFSPGAFYSDMAGQQRLSMEFEMFSKDA